MRPEQWTTEPMTSLDIARLAIVMLKCQAEFPDGFITKHDEQPKEAGTLNHD